MARNRVNAALGAVDARSNALARSEFCDQRVELDAAIMRSEGQFRVLGEKFVASLRDFTKIRHCDAKSA